MCLYVWSENTWKLDSTGSTPENFYRTSSSQTSVTFYCSFSCCDDPIKVFNCYFRALILLLLWITTYIFDLPDTWYAIPKGVATHRLRADAPDHVMATAYLDCTDHQRVDILAPHWRAWGLEVMRLVLNYIAPKGQNQGLTYFTLQKPCFLASSTVYPSSTVSHLSSTYLCSDYLPLPILYVAGDLWPDGVVSQLWLTFII